MKLRLVLLAICLAALSQLAAAQTTIKLFDANNIDVSTKIGAYAVKEVYLSCPANGRNPVFLTGPNGGGFTVDNFVTINGERACGKGKNCFTSAADPYLFVGEPVEMSYVGVGPVDITNQVRQSGLYTFALYDAGYTFGNTDLYLTTSCGVTSDTAQSQVCHRNMGQAGFKTLTVGPAAMSAHLAHGDTEGPCSAE